MKKIELRKISINDIDQLQEIGKRTFAETFSSTNSEQNMADYLETGFALQKLANELKNPDSAFYFAELDSQVIGYLKVNHGQSQTDIKDEHALEIERIYVLEEFHGKKVGQLLFDKAIDTAKDQDLEYVWLGVWEKNPRAIRFYQKNGFVEFGKHVFTLGDDDQTDLMMKLILV